MGWCGCRSDGVATTHIIEAIKAELNKIGGIFPGVFFATVISQDGEVIAFDDKGKGYTPPLFTSIAAVKRSAQLFAKVIKQPGPSIIHIKGTSTMFSLYEFDRNVLAFYSQMEPAQLAVFDTPAKDAGMKHIVSDLENLVDALMKVVYGGRDGLAT